MTHHFEKRPRVLVVASAYRKDIVDQLVSGAMIELEKAGCDIQSVEASGSLEIPGIISMASLSHLYDAYVGLGCILKGETIHDEVIAHAVFQSIQSLVVDKSLPIGNGILTVNTIEQAQERADSKRQNRGGEAAKAALNLLAHKGRFSQLSTAAKVA